MGRSGGGSGGGGGHSSGGFGGGHSSGGFSGGGRSGGHSGGGFGGGSGGYGGGPGGGRRGNPGGYRPPPHGHHRGFWHRRRYYDGPRGFGCGSNIIGIIVVIAVFVIVLLTAIPSSTASSSELANTTERTALSGQVDKTDWYEDNIGWVSSPAVMISGLEDFYNETGVQPYVLLVEYSSAYWNEDGTIDSTSADEYLETVYSETFTDEAHFIFAYFQCENDSLSEMDGDFRYLSGYSTDTIMDSEAISILWGYFESYYYDTSLTMEEMISNTFSSTASLIMSAPTNGWDVLTVVIICLCVVAVAVCIVLLIKNMNKRKKEKAQETENILNTPLDTFGDDTSDLEDKYK